MIFNLFCRCAIWPVTGQGFRLEMAKLASFNENFEFEYATAFSRLLGNGKHLPLPYFKKLAIRYSQTTSGSCRVLTNCEPASQRVMRVKPASHASHTSHHVSHARQMLVPSLA